MAQRWFRGRWPEKPFWQQRQRVARYFDCTWYSAWGEEHARISSLSPTGCYIESRFCVPASGAFVEELTIPLPDGSLNLHGTVLDVMRGVGFALRFAELDAETRDRLSVLVQDARRFTSAPMTQ